MNFILENSLCCCRMGAGGAAGGPGGGSAVAQVGDDVAGEGSREERDLEGRADWICCWLAVWGDQEAVWWGTRVTQGRGSSLGLEGP